MRVSANRSSPFYDADRDISQLQVLVDGVPVRHCVEASEEDGWADLVKTDDGGRILLDETRQASAIERLTGHVELVEAAR